MIHTQLPIIQAPMAGGATTPELVAAVSNAGGLGSLGAGYMLPSDISQAIKKIRKLTDKPFSVNLFIPEKHHATSAQIQNACHAITQCCKELNIKIEPVTEPYTPSFEDQVKVLLEGRVPVFSYTFGLLDASWVSEFKKINTILIGTATSLAEAHVLEENGVDAIVAQGKEAGGHRGTFISAAEDALIEISRLIPQLVTQIKIPIIAAGGIMEGRDIIAAMDLGASYVQMGTAFLCCIESGIPDVYKQLLLAQQQDNTVLTKAFSGKLARGLHNKFTDRMQSMQLSILDYPIQNALTMMMRKKAKEENNTDFMSLWAGQSVRFCRNMSVSDLINELVREMAVVGK